MLRDGSVKLDGTRHPSLSAAAVEVVKRNMNGWWFWKCRNERGEWIRLVHLGEPVP